MATRCLFAEAPSGLALQFQGRTFKGRVWAKTLLVMLIGIIEPLMMGTQAIVESRVGGGSSGSRVLV